MRVTRGIGIPLSKSDGAEVEVLTFGRIGACRLVGIT